jgi:hypothetical protein
MSRYSGCENPDLEQKETTSMANEILIELNDDELLAVSGGSTVAGIVQNIYQAAAIVQYGGYAGVAGGSVSFTQTLSGTITQAASNVNMGDVSVGIRE